jgi:hypothetical protein
MIKIKRTIIISKLEGESLRVVKAIKMRLDLAKVQNLDSWRKTYQKSMET